MLLKTEAVKRKVDADGVQTEVVCERCNAHLGHVFEGESLTNLNTRHCVNSLSLDFVDNLEIKDSEEAILAAERDNFLAIYTA